MNVLVVYPELQGFNSKSLGVSLLGGIIHRQGHKPYLFDTALYDQTQVLPDQALAYKRLKPFYWFKKSKVQPRQATTLHVDVVEAFRRKLEEIKPDLVLVTGTFLTYQLGLNLIAASNLPPEKVIYGGIHCTTAPEDAFAHEQVKYMHLGEAELSLPVILDTVFKGQPLDECKNLWVRRSDGTEVHNELFPLLENLDEAPYYYWDFYEDCHFERIYQGKVYRMADWSTSRGCFNRCSYCFNKQFFERYGEKRHFIRRYTVDRAIAELVKLRDEHGIEFIKFHDSDFLNMDDEYLEEFAPRYAREVGLPCAANGCIGHVSEHKAELLLLMGMGSISIGLESGSGDLRTKVLHRQKYSNEAFVKIVRMMRRKGLRVPLPVMIGLPGETREDISETIRVAKRSTADHADFGIFFPFPNLGLTNYAIKHGYLPENKEIGTFAFGLETALENNLSQKELNKVMGTGLMYIRLPYFLWPLIRLAEHKVGRGAMWKFVRKIYFLHLQYFDFSSALREWRRRRTLAELLRKEGIVHD